MFGLLKNSHSWLTKEPKPTTPKSIISQRVNYSHNQYYSQKYCGTTSFSGKFNTNKSSHFLQQTPLSVRAVGGGPSHATLQAWNLTKLNAQSAFLTFAQIARQERARAEEILAKVAAKSSNMVSPEDYVDFKAKPIRELTIGMRKSGGRNKHGHITVRHRGGGHKRRYRIIDFKRSLWDIPAIVNRLEYDPNRNCPIALVTYQTGEASYILAPEGLKPGDIIKTSLDAPIKVGYTLPLQKIPIGTLIHNIELTPGKGGQICRAAGTSAQVLKHGPKYVVLKLKSGEIREIHKNCLATVGNVSFYNYKPLGKAGASRWRGRRPKVRGVAMNPVDHPHGGGQGKTKGGRHSCSPWGILTKGYVTRNPRKTSKYRIIKNKRAVRKAEQELKNK